MLTPEMTPKHPPAAVPPARDAETRWAAVQARDWRADGQFVYAVTSTGVYCRPSCPSRRPARANVRFFERPAAAEGAGFRPCRRCAPDRTVTTDVAAMGRVRAWIDRHPDEPPRLRTLARLAGVSAFHLQRTFKRLVGVTPREYAAARRQLALRRALRGAPDVTGAVYEAGYSSSGRAYTDAAAHLGMTPGALRRGGAGERIAFDIVPSRLGRLLVAATERGVCFVAFGRADHELARLIAAEYPSAEITRAPGRLQPWVTELLRRVDDGDTRVALPLDLRATVFQRQVWQVLAGIPRGETRTYGEVAAALGRASAARAVARACATNPVAVAVPCHRVVAAGGGSGGYRWGVDRKAALLEAERTGR